MNEYELEFVSEGVSIEYAQGLVNRLNNAREKEMSAYQLLESARKIYDSYRNDKTLEIYEKTLDWYTLCANSVDDIITEIESAGGVID